MSIWLRIGGFAATEIAAHSPVTWETWANGGSGKASWSFALTSRSQHQGLKAGALVEVLCGPVRLWAGKLDYPDRTTWDCTAYGLFSAAKDYLALDGSGSSTRDIGAAIARARSLGWPVSNPSGIGGVVPGDPSGNPITLLQLLEDYGTQTGQRVGVDGTGRLFAHPDPTTPMWLASPAASAFGTTNEDRANTLAGRYLDSASGSYLTAFAGSGTPERDVDLTEKGAMSFIEAQVMLGGMLALDRTGTAWTNGVTLTSDQLQTLGGTGAFLPSVRAGQSMRSFGLAYTGTVLSLDTTIGLTRYTQGQSTIYVEPVNLAESSRA